MIIAVALFVVGFICLVKGGDWFVDGATGIANRFHLPELLIGATVVSIGTTLPEVMVSATAALGGHGEIAYGNAVGSIICNTGLIAAIPIAVCAPKIDRKTLKLPVAFFFLAVTFYMYTAYRYQAFSRTAGYILITMFVVYMVLTVWQMYRNPPQEESHEGDEIQQENSMQKNLVMLVVGAAVIAVGADLLVDNGTLIAEALGVPESVIALTFVALGTSLPELVTAVTSLMKGHGALSLGNVIGANLFNLVLVGGISAVLAPFSIPQGNLLFGISSTLVLELPLMLAMMLFLLVPALIKNKFYRFQGIVLMAAYATFCITQFVM